MMAKSRKAKEPKRASELKRERWQANLSAGSTMEPQLQRRFRWLCRRWW